MTNQKNRIRHVPEFKAEKLEIVKETATYCAKISSKLQ